MEIKSYKQVYEILWDKVLKKYSSEFCSIIFNQNKNKANITIKNSYFFANLNAMF